MRWTRVFVSVAASIASIAAGATASDETERERERAPAPPCETAGYAASGPSFYLWEEDAREGRRWACELARGAGSLRERAGPDEPIVSDQPGA